MLVCDPFDKEASDGASAPRAIQAADVRWARVRDLGRYPMGKLDRQVARSLQEQETRTRA